MNTVISDNKILRFRIIYFILLVSIVAVAISGYLGIASHYIVRDKNCVVLIVLTLYCAKLARANFYAYCVSILFITL